MASLRDSFQSTRITCLPRRGCASSEMRGGFTTLLQTVSVARLLPLRLALARSHDAAPFLARRNNGNVPQFLGHSAFEVDQRGADHAVAIFIVLGVRQRPLNELQPFVGQGEGRKKIVGGL